MFLFQIVQASGSNGALNRCTCKKHLSQIEILKEHWTLNIVLGALLIIIASKQARCISQIEIREETQNNNLSYYPFDSSSDCECNFSTSKSFKAPVTTKLSKKGNKKRTNSIIAGYIYEIRYKRIGGKPWSINIFAE